VEPRLLLGRAAPAMLQRNRSRVPVQILTGDADVGRPSHYLQLFPHTRHVEIPNAGHVMNLENPAGFNAAVSAFALHPQGVAAPLFSHTISPCP
jgi:pimeloyl-ACP methyl ester carboxylesterase